jgi:hypothetical protein
VELDQLLLGISIAVGACMGIAIIGCVNDIRTRRSTPYLLAWVIRTSLCALLFCAMASKGASLISLTLWAVQLGGGLCIIGMTIAYGTLGRLDWVDKAALAVAGAGAGAWALSGDALYSILGTVAADIVATSIGIRAALRDGKLESMRFWGLALCAGSLTLVSVSLVLVATPGNILVLLVAPVFSVSNALANIFAIWWITRRQALSPMPVAGETLQKA